MDLEPNVWEAINSYEELSVHADLAVSRGTCRAGCMR